MFNPGLEIGQILKNSEIVEIFKCGNMGGMRRSKTTNTLVIVSDYTREIDCIVACVIRLIQVHKIESCNF